MEARLRQFGRDDAPREPDRKTDVLGNDRPDQVASGDELALGVPKLLIFWIPVRNPSGRLLAHLKMSPVRMFAASVPAHSVPIKKPQPRTHRPQRGCFALVGPSLDLMTPSLRDDASGPPHSSFVPVDGFVVLFSEIRSMVDSMEVPERS
jgi:hypothetical protein